MIGEIDFAVDKITQRDWRKASLLQSKSDVLAITFKRI